MKIKELIKNLEEILAVEGDLEVGVLDLQFGNCHPLYSIQVRERSPVQDHFHPDSAELGDKFVSI